MVNCAPDLPFFETVLWHLKQFAAIMVIIGLFAILVGLGYLIFTPKSRR
jgi:hypothetical protein